MSSLSTSDYVGLGSGGFGVKQPSSGFDVTLHNDGTGSDNDDFVITPVLKALDDEDALLKLI